MFVEREKNYRVGMSTVLSITGKCNLFNKGKSWGDSSYGAVIQYKRLKFKFVLIAGPGPLFSLGN